jgi:hypothetical protein
MKKIFLIFLVMAIASTTAFADVILRFDLNNYIGWDYTRPGFVLNTENINQNNVNLYKASDNTDYTLVSPLVNKGTAQHITINVVAYSKLYNNPNYDPYKGSPTIEILDSEGNVMKSVFHQFVDKAFVRTFSVDMYLTDLPTLSKFKIRLACWNAGIYSALSIREVVVDDGRIHGDVNGDGNVTAADVTALYDYLLNNDTSSLANGDQDGDGIITAGDITAVYNILLGN